MVAAGRRLGIPALSLPHGMSVFANKFVNEMEISNGLADRNYANDFDRIVYQSRLHASRSVDEGVDPTKIVVLGSARYCSEWHQINMRIQPKCFVPSKGKGCSHRVVFMVSQWTYNVDFESTNRTFRRLADEPWIHLVLKPHPREVETQPAYLRDLESYFNVEIAAQVASPALVDWADTVITIGSSITLEILAQGKNHLHPSYLHKNTTVFQIAGSEWTVESDDELIAAIRHLSEGGQVPYGTREIQEVVDILIKGNLPDEDVLQRYADFVVRYRDFPVFADLERTSPEQPAVEPEKFIPS